MDISILLGTIFSSCITTFIRFDFMNQMFDKKISVLRLNFIKIMYVFFLSIFVYFHSPILNMFVGLILTPVICLYCYSSNLKTMCIYNLFLFSLLTLIEVGLALLLNTWIMFTGINLNTDNQILLEYLIFQTLMINIYYGLFVPVLKKKLVISFFIKHYVYLILYVFYVIIIVNLISKLTFKLSEFSYVALILQLGLVVFSYFIVGLIGSVLKEKELLQDKLEKEKEIHKLQLKFERNIFHEALERHNKYGFDENNQH